MIYQDLYDDIKHQNSDMINLEYSIEEILLSEIDKLKIKLELMTENNTFWMSAYYRAMGQT